MFSIIEILDLAIQIEKNGEAFYRNGLKKVSGHSLRPLLEWLADEEAGHIRWFMEKREGALGTERPSLMEEAGMAALRDILGNQTFSLQEAELSAIRNEENLLDLAREFEKDTILFFEMVRTLVDDEGTLALLQKIIEEENHHLQLIDAYDKRKGE